MQYLVFGALLILGAVVIGLFLFSIHAKNKVEAVVLESFCDVKRMEGWIEDITVTHKLEIEMEGTVKKIETDLIPVRELNGAKISLYYDKKMETVYLPDYERYAPFLLAFFLSGVLCIAFYFLNQDVLARVQMLGETDWLALLLGVIAVVAFSHVTKIINPAVLKAKGNFEGFLKSEDDDNDIEVYSLWYGEHRQYAKRRNGMLLKNDSEKTVTLFYNTKRGMVCRLQEFVISVCISVLAFFAMVVVLVIM